jgi:hypothetical protein
MKVQAGHILPSKVGGKNADEASGVFATNLARQKCAAFHLHPTTSPATSTLNT